MMIKNPIHGLHVPTPTAATLISSRNIDRRLARRHRDYITTAYITTANELLLFASTILESGEATHSIRSPCFTVQIYYYCVQYYFRPLRLKLPRGRISTVN
jgi:hypothetical protein